MKNNYSIDKDLTQDIVENDKRLAVHRLMHKLPKI